MGSCRIPRPSDPAAAARAEVVELLFEYVDRLRVHFEDVSAHHGLTPVQAKVLMFVDEPSPMRCVAELLGCDPSNVTGVVDRLEERGLLERAVDPSDRRVTSLRSTQSGRTVRDALGAALFKDVPGMSGLSRDQVAGLRDLLARLCADTPAASVTPRA